MKAYLFAALVSTIAYAQNLQPKQSCFVQLMATQLNQDRIGWFDKGHPDVRISIDDKLVYSSRARRGDAEGIECKFNELIELAYTPGQMFKVELYDIDTLSDDQIFEVATSSYDPIYELFSNKLEKGGSFIEFKRVYPRGRYLIRLERSFVAPDDFYAIGGKGDIKKMEVKQLHLLPYYTNLENAANDIYVSINKSIEAVNNRILIYQNGKKIADTADRVIPEGPAVGLWNIEFEIFWSPNDEIKIVYEDVDSVSNDLILETSSNTDKSLHLLSGATYGGKNQQSFIVFSARKLKDN